TPTGRVVLLDFGLAAPVSPTTGSTKRAGVLLGTRGYISPEQARGEPLTPAADWYSFGVTLFEAATGRLPFDDSCKAFLADRRLQGRPRISELVPDAPPALDELVAALLDPLPRRRPDESQVLRAVSARPAAVRSAPRP